MLPDPLTIGTAYLSNPSVPRTSSEPNKSVYTKLVGTDNYVMTISHSINKGRRRTQIRLDVKRLVSDPYVTAQNVEDTTSTYLVIDRSERLVTNSDVVAYVTELLGGQLAFCAKANVTDSRLTQIVQGES